MVRNPIAETTLAGLRPTGVAGRRVLDSWEQIDGYLRSAQAADVADLFAEPVVQPGGRITWFAEGAAVHRFADLPPDEQDALRRSLGERMARLDGEIDRLVTSTNPTARLIGETLQRAQRIPGAVEDSLYAVDGRPVLVNWSVEPEGAPPETDPLKEFVRLAAAPKPADPPPPVPQPPTPEPLPSDPAPEPSPVPATVLVVERPFPWWSLLWLLFALLMAAILYVLLIGCGVWPGGRVLDHCPVRPIAAAPASPDPEALRTDALRAELAALEQRLDRAPRCAPPPAPPSRPQTAQQPPSTEFDRRIAASGATEGELTITLIWNTPSDLDLHIRCPSGEEIAFNNANACGGTLDVDANSAAPHRDGKPVENVYFRSGAAGPGTYRVVVHNFEHRSAGPDRFQVRVKKNADVTVHDGVVAAGAAAHVVDVRLP